jgi:hypothetical protein
VGVIGGDYSKLWVDSLLFLDGIVGHWHFFHFRFFRGEDAPTIITDRPTPLPPIEKSTSYPQATVDSVDNFCKSLILLEFFYALTNC